MLVFKGFLWKVNRNVVKNAGIFGGNLLFITIYMPYTASSYKIRSEMKFVQQPQYFNAEDQNHDFITATELN